MKKEGKIMFGMPRWVAILILVIPLYTYIFIKTKNVRAKLRQSPTYPRLLVVIWVASVFSFAFLFALIFYILSLAK